MAQFAVMPIEDYRRACDAIREKTGGTEGITSGELEAQILSIETGTQLPVLVSPGAAEDLKYGRQLIDQEGKVVTGAMPGSTIYQWDLMYPEYSHGPFRLRLHAYKGFNDGVPQTIPLSGLPYMDEFGNVRYANFTNNGATNGNLDGLNSTSVNVPEGYTEGGEITFDDTALAARLDGIQGTTSEGTLDEKFTRSENEVQTQAELLDQIEAILNGEAEGPGGSEGGGGSGSSEPETCKVTVWAGRTSTNLLVCFPNGDRPAYVPLSGSGDVRYDVTVPKNSMIFVEKQGGNPTVRGAYRCTYTLVPLRNTSYPAVLAKITEDGASLSID